MNFIILKQVCLLPCRLYPLPARISSDLIPADLIGRQIQGDAAAVSCVDCGALRLVGIVHNTILSILHIDMDFHIEVGAVPFVQVFLIVGSPNNAAVQNAAVFKAVRQTADIHGTALTELVDRHLHLLVLLLQFVPGTFLILIPFALYS